MIINCARLKNFYNSLIATENIPHQKAMAIYDALYNEAVKLGAISSGSILDGLDTTIKIAKALNGLGK